MVNLIGSIDQGTTSTRFVVFDDKGVLITFHQVELTQIHPQPGWVEHDPYEIISSVHTCIEHTIQKLDCLGYSSDQIKCIGITNQRETLITWDRLTGHPLYPAILWSDTRTIETVETLSKTKESQLEALKASCGLPLTTYFSAVKLRWLLDHLPTISQARDQNRLCFGTVDTWLIYNLTGGVHHQGLYITDATNASRTMLMDINTLDWSQTALDFFEFENIKLPRIVSSSEIYGYIHEGSLKGIPLSGCLGDQQAALVGQQCFEPGDAKSTYGTGCFMLLNTGETPIESRHGLLTTVAYQFEGKAIYALEGSIASAGSSIQWLRDNLGLIKDAEELNVLASSVKSTAGVYFVNAFAGLFAPYWRSDARGTMCGITQFTRREHICRALLEAICYQSRAVLEAMKQEADYPLRMLKVDGGLSNSDLCMQIQADLLGIAVYRPDMRESTALGAAMAAGLALGIWKSIHDLAALDPHEKSCFEPKISETRRQKMCRGWEHAIQRSYGWANPDTTVSTSETVL